MKSALTVCIGIALLTATASTADAWRSATGPRGGTAVAGPRGAAGRAVVVVQIGEGNVGHSEPSCSR